MFLISRLRKACLLSRSANGLYPNPTSNYLTITVNGINPSEENLFIEIADVSGKVKEITAFKTMKGLISHTFPQGYIWSRQHSRTIKSLQVK
ncbi:MAG: T9SS type A sorting domain-containing protein [Bacteroidetes bacterium]|nr:T9SS type A sorting domain-containing protein [Bacteroidota bacterium]